MHSFASALPIARNFRSRRGFIVSGSLDSTVTIRHGSSTWPVVCWSFDPQVGLDTRRATWDGSHSWILMRRIASLAGEPLSLRPA
jgi:hypothetical protein